MHVQGGGWCYAREQSWHDGGKCRKQLTRIRTAEEYVEGHIPLGEVDCQVQLLMVILLGTRARRGKDRQWVWRANGRCSTGSFLWSLNIHLDFIQVRNPCP